MFTFNRRYFYPWVYTTVSVVVGITFISVAVFLFLRELGKVEAMHNNGITWSDVYEYKKQVKRPCQE